MLLFPIVQERPGQTWVRIDPIHREAIEYAAASVKTSVERVANRSIGEALRDRGRIAANCSRSPANQLSSRPTLPVATYRLSKYLIVTIPRHRMFGSKSSSMPPMFSNFTTSQV